MEIFSCFSIFLSKAFTNYRTIEPKKKQLVLRNLYSNFKISSDDTKIELTEEFIVEMKEDEDFVPNFHKQFMDFILSYEKIIIYNLENEEILNLVTETFGRWIIAIKIHPLSPEFFEERKAICRVFSSRSYLFRDWFYARFRLIWLNYKLFEEPEKFAIGRSWVIWSLRYPGDCDEFEKSVNIKL